VVRERGERCGIGWAFIRNLLLIIPDGILWGIVGLIVALTNENKQRVGDLAAGTYVVDKGAVGHPVLRAPAGFAGYGAPGQAFYGQPGQPAQPPSQPAATSPVSQPQWDQARNTYIWWDPQQQQWLEHDQASDQWRPISQ
ncbi:MAG: RDD family protein, partial [Acidimicrobiales bacterium]